MEGPIAELSIINVGRYFLAQLREPSPFQGKLSNDETPRANLSSISILKIFSSLWDS
jgi:hypothetical protein